MAMNPAKHNRTAVRVASFCLVLWGAVSASAQTTLGIEFAELGSGRRVAVPQGGSRSLQGRVRNLSGHQIAGVALTCEPPQGWSVKAVPESLGALGPGEVKPFLLQLTPPRTIFSQKRWITIQAGPAGEKYPAQHSFYAVVNTWRIWATVGGSLAVVVIACFIFIYRRVSRD